MVKINFLVAVLAAIIPLIVGSLWYNPKTFALAWMREAEISEDKLKGAKMPLIFGLTFVFSFFLAVGLHFLVIHQIHLGSIVLDPVLRQISPEGEADVAAFMAKYGSNYRTFKHGMLHGGMTALMFALPIVGINALFERRSFKYIAIHVGYWFVTLMLMGGVVCQWA